MSRSGGRVVAAIAGAVALLAGACSADDEQVVAAGDTAEAEVAAALDDAAAGSGRIEFTARVDPDAMAEAFATFEEQAQEWADASEAEPGSSETWSDADTEYAVVVEFDGDDYRAIDEETSEPTALQVGGTAYRSVQEAADIYGGMSGDDELDADEIASPEPRIPEGVEWIEVDQDTSALPLGEGASISGPGSVHLLRADQLSDVREAGTSEVDGAPTRRFTAALTEEAMDEFIGGGAPGTGDEPASGALSDEELAQYEAFEEYFEDHVRTDIEIHLDDDGRLVRIQMSMSVELDEQYVECLPLVMAAAPTTITADYEEPEGGVDLDLTEPSADSVISQEDFDELVDEAFDEWMRDPPGDLPTGPSERAIGPDGELVKLLTVDGERFRADIEDDLEKFGSVIDLDPDTIGDLDDAALVEAHDRASAAIAALPTTPTELGDLTRVELEWNVEWGMETVGADTLSVESMGDRELGALIDGFVGEYGLAGDGIWGDGPMSHADMESVEWTDELELSDDELEALGEEGDHLDGADGLDPFGDLHAGCPGGDSDGG